MQNDQLWQKLRKYSRVRTVEIPPQNGKENAPLVANGTLTPKKLFPKRPTPMKRKRRFGEMATHEKKAQNLSPYNKSQQAQLSGIRPMMAS